MISKFQIKHVARLLKQLLNKPKFSVIGGYHGVNLGDLALGFSVKNIIEESGFFCGMQTIYNLNAWPWPRTSYTIVGGGAVGYEYSLQKLIEKLDGNYKGLAFLGVDFNEADYSEPVIEMLKQADWISCRNQMQAERIIKITLRQDITYHPDLVFSYKTQLSAKLRHAKKEKKLLINVVPLYGDFVNGVMIPKEVYKSERPELYEKYESMIQAYRQSVRDLANNYLGKGYSVETLAFEPDDDKVAKWFLEGMNVKFHEYTDDLEEMFSIIGTSECILATRYHATIIGIKVGSKLIPMTYAEKNDKLLLELGVDKSQYLSALDLANGLDEFPSPIKISDNIVKEWEENSRNTILNCIKNLKSAK